MTKRPPSATTKTRVLGAAESLRKALSAYQKRVSTEAPGMLQKAEKLRKAICAHQRAENAKAADASERGPHGEVFKLLNRHMRRGSPK
ncbi:MAG: hypothetical protein PHT19_17625 [Methylococcus sp.]|nr:hypothetical protein [Methylococcus sp.]